MFKTISKFFGMGTSTKKRSATKRKTTAARKKRKVTTKKAPVGYIKKETVRKKLTSVRKSLGL